MERIRRDKREEERIRQTDNAAVIQIASFVDSLSPEDMLPREIPEEIYLSIFIYAYYSGLNCTELLSEEIEDNYHLKWLIASYRPSFDSLQDYREENEEKIRETLLSFRSYALSHHMLRFPDILFKGYRPSQRTRADKLPHDAYDDDISLFLRDFSYNDRYEHPLKRPDWRNITRDDINKMIDEFMENSRKEDEEAERDGKIIEAVKKK